MSSDATSSGHSLPVSATGGRAYVNPASCPAPRAVRSSGVDPSGPQPETKGGRHEVATPPLPGGPNSAQLPARRRSLADRLRAVGPLFPPQPVPYRKRHDVQRKAASYRAHTSFLKLQRERLAAAERDKAADALAKQWVREWLDMQRSAAREALRLERVERARLRAEDVERKKARREWARIHGKRQRAMAKLAQAAAELAELRLEDSPGVDPGVAMVIKAFTEAMATAREWHEGSVIQRKGKAA